MIQWRRLVDAGYLCDRHLRSGQAYQRVAFGIVDSTFRARRLLEENLNPEQLASWHRSTGRKYRVGRRGVISDGRAYCIVQHGMFPVAAEDEVLMRKLLIEHYEEYFLRTAVHSHGLVQRGLVRIRRICSTIAG